MSVPAPVQEGDVVMFSRGRPGEVVPLIVRGEAPGKVLLDGLVGGTFPDGLVVDAAELAVLVAMHEVQVVRTTVPGIDWSPCMN